MGSIGIDHRKAKNAGCEPIAIVGMGCRWPGDSESPSELWDFLQARLNAYGRFPEDRIRTDSFYHPNANRPGSFYTEGGAFLKSNPRDFDHTFFGIHPREVLSMDPAQRKFMEVVYEALESSGTPLHALAGSRTGCFVGNFNYDHQLMQYRDAEYPEPYSVTGGGITVLSNRVNYLFDLKGPSMTLDTACSSSMYALHLACSAIQSGECSAAIVGGSNLILTPECQIFSSVLGAVSPTSICHTFDAAADGYARADGIGALYIKSLTQAIEDGDPIRAIIRGTAINANGRTGGITHPSPDGQEAVIRRAYERAGNLDPSETGYFECHGTGTAVGDPLEVSAIGRVFAGVKSASSPLLIGSIKSNLGHSEPSSGIAGIMKAVLAIERGVIPPTVGLKTLNPNLDLKGGALKIVTESMPWPNAVVRRASINSFGYGGANAHTIVESVDSILPGYRELRQVEANQQPSLALSSKTQSTRTKYLLPFSAHDERTLAANIVALKSNATKWDVADIAYTLSARRSLLSHRSFGVVSTESSTGLLDAGTSSVVKRPTASPTLGFVFTGQGAQWPGMGAALMQEFPQYLRTLRALDASLDNLKDGRTWTIEDALLAGPEESKIHTAELSQPLVTATQIALVNLLADWGILPSAVVGHSSGEIAAAYAAGLITQEDAILAAYFRGKVVAHNTQNGLMMAAGVGATEAEKYLNDYQGQVVVACQNSPDSVTLSGNAEAIMKVKEALDADKRFARLLSTGGNAYHSHHMLPLGQEYENQLPKDTILSSLKAAKSSSNPNSPKFFSSVVGQELPAGLMGASYWRRNLESPVLFTQAVSALVTKAPVDILVEIGPHSALQGPLRQIAQSLSVPFPEYLTAIVRKNDNANDVLTLAGNLFAKGYKVDLEQVNASEGVTGRVITDFPHYQWQYSEVLMNENRYTREWRQRMHPRHDILGSRVPGGVKDEPIWRNILRAKDLAWLAEHRVGQETVFPSTGYLSMALEAATQAIEVNGSLESSIESYDILNVSLQKALIIPEDDGAIETLFTLRRAPLNNNSDYESRFHFVLTSVTTANGEDSFVEHCRGTVAVNLKADDDHIIASPLVAEWKNATAVMKSVSSAQWYEKFASVGLEYGPIFQGLSDVKGAEKQRLAEAKIGLKPTEKIMSGESRYVIHPAALDAAMQLCIVASHSGTATQFKRAMMPVGMSSIRIWPKAAQSSQEPAQCVAKGALKGVRGLFASLTLLGDGHKPIIEAKDILLIASDQGVLTSHAKDSPYTRMVWQPAFDSLDQKAVEQLYPPITLDDSAVLPSLNSLALHQLIHFHETQPDIFARGSTVPHLQRLLDWTEGKLQLAYENPSSPAKQIRELKTAQREERIAALETSLNPQSSESRLMCHLYHNLPAIYAGEKTGIQVALQDNLLIDNYEQGQVYREGNKRLGSIISLLGHQKPDLKILEVGAGTGSATREILPALQGNTPWRRYVEYRFTDTTTSFLASAEETFKDFGGMSYGAFDMEQPAADQGYSAEWDLIVASNVIHATSDIKRTLANIRGALKPGGKMILLELTRSNLSAGLVLGTFSDFWKGDLDPEYPRNDGPFLSKDLWRAVLPKAGFEGLDFYLDDYAEDNVSATVICATAAPEPVLNGFVPVESVKSTEVALVYRDASSPTIAAIAEHLTNGGVAVHMVHLSDVGQLPCSRLLSVVEVERPLFADITPSEWEGLQRCVKQANSALWVTSGALMDGREPLCAMISGIARGLKIEVAQLQLTILDLDRTPGTAMSNEDLDLIMHHEENTANPEAASADMEFRRKDGITYISRLVSDAPLNEQSKSRRAQQESMEEASLSSLRSTPLKLTIDKPGVLSTLHFVEDSDFALPLPDDYVQIEVAAASVNNKDLAVVTGRHHSDTFSDECAGTITQVGAAVKDLMPGNRVYCQSFAKFGNFVRDKASFCQKMEPEDTFEAVATLPIAFCTAIYGLMDLGRLRRGESVLIQSATGAVGLAAVQVAKLCGAEIYVTVGTPEKKAELLQMGYGIAEDHIFPSRDPTAPQQILEQTGGKGIDVILCSARGELMHEYWRTIASMGRFVEIGRTEVLDNGHLQLDVFRRNATFTSFDLEVMSKSHPEIIADLMHRLNFFKRTGFIQTLPLETYHVSEIDRALMTFGKAAHIGKIVISYDNGQGSAIKVRRSPFSAMFDPEAVYLLVGCLGGLGRSFTRWAVQRGARHLVYLSRSGAASRTGQLFLDELRDQGVEARVIQGDVAQLDDVRAAVASQTRPIKGVVQGALTLHDGLFDSMSLDDFYATVRPRVQGTLNLHEALKDAPLDFFELWSSWTVLFGTATQSNYLASNAFMDAFARHRSSHGQPVTSLALSQVLGIGIVSYMPEYQQAMVRNGFYGNDEDEFLQYCDACLAPVPNMGPPDFYDPMSHGHLLVGIEPAGLEEIRSKYPLEDMAWARDPRFANLLQATSLLAGASSGGANGGAGDGSEELSVVERVRHKISRLLYVSLDEVDADTPINSYGIDSMVAAEVRNWLFQKFGKDVTLLSMLAPTTTIRTLAEEMAAQ